MLLNANSAAFLLRSWSSMKPAKTGSDSISNLAQLTQLIKLDTFHHSTSYLQSTFIFWPLSVIHSCKWQQSQGKNKICRRCAQWQLMKESLKGTAYGWDLLQHGGFRSSTPHLHNANCFWNIERSHVDERVEHLLSQQRKTHHFNAIANLHVRDFVTCAAGWFCRRHARYRYRFQLLREFALDRICIFGCSEQKSLHVDCGISLMLLFL